jgi:hypothetical protein
MLAMGFMRSPKANGIRLIMHSKAERFTRLAISFTPTVMQMAFPTRNNTTNTTSNRIVENPMYRLKPLMERRTWGQNKCLRKQEIFMIRCKAWNKTTRPPRATAYHCVMSMAKFVRLEG